MTTITSEPPAVGAMAAMRRLTEFAADAAHLAADRRDPDLRALVDDLHRDLLVLREDR